MHNHDSILQAETGVLTQALAQATRNQHCIDLGMQAGISPSPEGQRHRQVSQGIEADYLGRHASTCRQNQDDLT